MMYHSTRAMFRNVDSNKKLKIRSTYESKISCSKTQNTRWESTNHHHNKSVTAVLWTSDDRFALSVSSDKTIQLWNAETGARRGTITPHHKYPILSIAWLPSLQCYASLDIRGTIRMWDISMGGIPDAN